MNLLAGSCPVRVAVEALRQGLTGRDSTAARSHVGGSTAPAMTPARCSRPDRRLVQFRLETPGVASRSDDSEEPQSLAELGLVSA